MLLKAHITISLVIRLTYLMNLTIKKRHDQILIISSKINSPLFSTHHRTVIRLRRIINHYATDLFGSVITLANIDGIAIHKCRKGIFF